MKTNSFEECYKKYRAQIEQWMWKYCRLRSPRSVYGPMVYILSSGGKRVRPVLVLLACETVSGEWRPALPAACAVEILHNFTLVHDDVMDNAGLRRGRPTIHTKWDTNVAILTGDQMAACAYTMLMRSITPRIREVVGVFTRAFNEVCEGQGLDQEFESRSRVGLHEYRRMIARKTGRVIASSAEIGAIIGQGTPRQVTALRRFGESLGLAFQIKDDLLDVAGDEREFGKKIGGDIVEGKKTFLLLRAYERARGREKIILRRVMQHRTQDRTSVTTVRRIYENLGILDEAESMIRRCTRRAEHELARLPARQSRDMLAWLSEQLRVRSV